MLRKLFTTGLFFLTACGSSHAPLKDIATDPSESYSEKRVPFTADFRNAMRLSDKDVKKLQFFIHDKVTLTREVTDGEKGIVHGKLVLRSGRNIDEIELPAGTPGVAYAVQSDRVMVCFEESCDEDSTITFGCLQECQESTSGPRKYVSLAREWKNNKGIIEYAGAIYEMSPLTYIEVDNGGLDKLKRKKRVLTGATVSP